MMKGLTFFILIYFGFVSGVLAKEPKATGLYVKFKKGAEDHEIKKLHDILGSSLDYRSKTLKIDSVAFKKKLSLYELNHICKKYLASPLVLDCEINFQYSFPSKKNKSIECESPFTSIFPSEQLNDLSNILEHIQLYDPCSLVVKKGLPTPHLGLTPLWSQEYIGSDLSRELLRNYEDDKQVSVGNIDSPFSREHITGNTSDNTDVEIKKGNIVKDHATSTVNLLNGKEPIGVSENAVISNLYDILNEPGKLLGSVDSWAKNPPDVTNLEIHCRIPGNGYHLNPT